MSFETILNDNNSIVVMNEDVIIRKGFGLDGKEAIMTVVVGSIESR
jgi:hypothetical protein